jgi:hypothetical protein
LLLLLLWRSVTRDFGVARSTWDRNAGQTYIIYLIVALLAAAAMGYTGYLGGYVARGY